jgi:8-amino-7-oxononanoate synthase
VIEALTEAARVHGVSVAGSRATTGNHPLYGDLEEALAEFMGVERVVLCASGYLSSAVFIRAVRDQHSHVFLAEGAHSSVQEAALLAEVDVTPFAGAPALETALQRMPGGYPLVLCDGVAPSTGHLSPVADYWRLLEERNGSRLLIDDAHGVGVLGANGRGIVEEAGLTEPDVFIAGTLSKAFGCAGGFVAGDTHIIRHLQARSTPFIGATPLPPPIAAAALRAVRTLRSEPERIARLRERALRVKALMRECGYPVSEGAAPICSLTFEEPAKRNRFRELLLQREIYPSFIRYPGAPSAGHFRFTLSSEHSDEQIERLCDAVREAVG